MTSPAPHGLGRRLLEHSAVALRSSARPSRPYGWSSGSDGIRAPARFARSKCVHIGYLP
jgi:hypothetical protein